MRCGMRRGVLQDGGHKDARGQLVLERRVPHSIVREDRKHSGLGHGRNEARNVSVFIILL
jgi:hypothetical protein